MRKNRKTKILCTIGPASSSRETLASMARAGMSAVRLNFSHGTHESHAEAYRNVRRAEKETGIPLAVVQDLQGPRIRLGDLGEAGYRLKKGQRITLSPRSRSNPDKGIFPVDYPGMDRDVAKGEAVLVNEGKIRLRILEIREGEIRCEVRDGGMVSSHKGINLPGTRISMPSVTEKDLRDLRFGLKLGVDIVAVSFVREAGDLEPARKIIRNSGRRVLLVAKIEKPEALKNARRIMEAADGIMIARGDLGIEVSLEEVPVHQKDLIEMCRKAGKPVITATQMLESMISAPIPTRAEAADVANAVFDGTDCLMLSGETAVGRYPVRVVRTMDRIAREAEKHPSLARKTYFEGGAGFSDAEAIAHAAVDISEDLSIPIVAFTISGSTAMRISSFRPQARILALTPRPGTLRHLCVVWGIEPREAGEVENTDEMLQLAGKTLLSSGTVPRKGKFVLVAGVPIKREGITNLIKIHEART